MSVSRTLGRSAVLIAAAAGVLASASPSLAQPLIRAAFHPSYKGTVGVCLLVDPRVGAVLDAKVVEPSGNPNLDASIGAWARTLTLPAGSGLDASAAAQPQWLPMYASFEGAPGKNGLPNCAGVRGQMARN